MGRGLGRRLPRQRRGALGVSIERLREHPVLRYALAVIAAGATIAALIPLRFLVEPLPSPPFLLMVMVVAWLAGFGPAIVSVIISALALDYWFVPPLGALVTTWHEAASVVSFIAIGTGVAWLTATRRQVEDDRQALLVRERASRASAEAANRVAIGRGSVTSAANASASPRSAWMKIGRAHV